MENDQEKKLLFKELLSKQQEFEENGGIPPHGPLYQHDALEKLDKEKSVFESGQKIALLGAIRICANHNILMPEWVQKAYIASYDQVLSCKTADWNEAFGTPYKGKQISRLRQNRKNKFGIYNLVSEAIARGISTGKGFYEDIGSRFGVADSKTEELYRKVKKQFEEDDGNYIERERKKMRKNTQRKK